MRRRSAGAGPAGGERVTARRSWRGCWRASRSGSCSTSTPTRMAPPCSGTPASSGSRGSCRSGWAPLTGRAHRGTGSRSRTPIAWGASGKDVKREYAMEKVMVKRKPKRTEKVQSQRIKEIAQLLRSDETGRVFERDLKKCHLQAVLILQEFLQDRSEEGRISKIVGVCLP
jgi:hypothetical protein